MTEEVVLLRRCSVGELDASYRAVFMPQGLGDILFFLMYVTPYRQIIPEERIAVVVIKKHFMQLAELFADRIDALCYLDMAEEPIWQSKMTYLYDGIYNSDPQPYLLRAIQNAMGLPENARAYLPKLPQPRNTEELEKQYPVRQGRTILIAPDAVSCSINVSDVTWFRIAALCTQAGFSVLFNVADSGRFGNYPTVFLSLVETLHLIAKGGNFIGFRSGLCDVMAAFTDVNSLILYPSNKQPGEFPSILGYNTDPSGAYMRYCSLKNIFPQRRMTEMLYRGEDDLLRVVINEVNKWQEC